jgi:two-component system LytT family response regulator
MSLPTAPPVPADRRFSDDGGTARPSGLRSAVVDTLRMPNASTTESIERRGWLLLGAVLIVLSLVTMPQLALQYRMRGVDLPLAEVVFSGFATWLPFFLLAPAIFTMARRFPLEPGNWRRSFGVHILGSLAVCVAYAGCRWAASHIPLVDPVPLPFSWLLVSQFYLAFQSYWVLVAVHQAWHNYKRFRDRALRASQLEARLARAQLEVLKGQLHPHFLFNTLNAISTLVHRDAHAADEMITQLSDLLRLSLESIGVQEVRLGQEVEFLSRYLDIQRHQAWPRDASRMRTDRGDCATERPLARSRGARRRPGLPPGSGGPADARHRPAQHPGAAARVVRPRRRADLVEPPRWRSRGAAAPADWRRRGALRVRRRSLCMTLRTLIVDDEPLARERVRMMLGMHDDVAVVGEYGDGQQAIDAIRTQRPDLVFLDVQMPGVDGFGVLRALEGEVMPYVVFVTAYDQYALRAFEVHALDYVLKPFNAERFSQALQRARSAIAKRDEGEVGVDRDRLRSLVASLTAEQREKQRIVVKSSGRVFFVKVDDIDWIEAEGNYVRLHMGAQSHLLRETMKGMESVLDTSQFIRIHRSTIVNADRIRELQPLFHGEYAVILRDGTRLVASRGPDNRLKKLLAEATIHG